jgi:hypothetical protein
MGISGRLNEEHTGPRGVTYLSGCPGDLSFDGVLRSTNVVTMFADFR